MAGKQKAKKREIRNYTHKGKQRLNNPPVGLVTPDTDQDQEKKLMPTIPTSILSWYGQEK